MISVIINCYNSESYIKEAIDSVISQTYINWEIVLWDNQSTDETKKIVQSYGDPRIKYFLAPIFTTLSKARKLAIEKANGKYLAFLDSDDYWHPNKLELQYNLLECQSEIGIVHTNFRLVSDKDDLQMQLQHNYYATIKQDKYENKNIYLRLLYSNYIIFSSLLIRRKVYEAIGGINDSFNQNEDYELLLKASRITKASNIAEELTFYRIHTNNQSYKNKELSYIENQIIFKSLSESFQSKLAYYRNQFRYNLFLLESKKIGLLFLLNPINCYFILEYIIRRILK